MNRKKRNQWRKWQASAVATLAAAALFQYVRSSDAFDVAYAAANGTDTNSTPSIQMDARDDVMDEWTSSRADDLIPNQDAVQGNQSMPSSSRDSRQHHQESDSGISSGNYQSRTGAS